MTFNLNSKGKPISYIEGGKLDGYLLFIDPEAGHIDEKDHLASRFKKYYGKLIELPTGSKFEMIPDIESRTIAYICGASGSGKSTLTRMFVLNFIRMFKHKKIYLF